MKLSHRIRSIAGSGTAAMFAKVEANQGNDIVNFAIGEPCFETHDAIVQATQRALDKKETKYSAISGLSGLRKKLALLMGAASDKDRIIITNGAKQALFSAFQVIIDPGDEVIIPSPNWVSFTHQVVLAGGVPVSIPVSDADHQLDLKLLSERITQKTKAILLNTPNNPTGAVYPVGILKKVHDIALKNNLYLVLDETYEDLIYDFEKKEALLPVDMHDDSLIRIRSFSKQYSMTGFRIGYAFGSKDVIGAMGRLQSHLCGNVSTFSQYGSLAALEMDSSLLKKQKKQMRKKRDFAYNEVSKWSHCVKPQGAFYLFPKIKRYLSPGFSSRDFAELLFEKARVAVIPGEEFGISGHIRISFAMEQKQLEAGLNRIRKVL